MNEFAPAPKRMTVAEFLAWNEDNIRGRYELINGVPIAMAPERVKHAEIKLAAAMALLSAVKRAKLGCHVLPDGMTVQVDADTAYEPDALVYCGETLPADAIIVPAPVIVVEVLSPSTRYVDTGAKLAGYLQAPSVRHYLIIDPVRRLIVHHARGDAGRIETRIVSDGVLQLDPPGMGLEVSACFEAS